MEWRWTGNNYFTTCNFSQGALIVKTNGFTLSYIELSVNSWLGYESVNDGVLIILKGQVSNFTDIHPYALAAAINKSKLNQFYDTLKR